MTDDHERLARRLLLALEAGEPVRELRSLAGRLAVNVARKAERRRMSAEHKRMAARAFSLARKSRDCRKEAL